MQWPWTQVSTCVLRGVLLRRLCYFPVSKPHEGWRLLGAGASRARLAGGGQDQRAAAACEPRTWVQGRASTFRQHHISPRAAAGEGNIDGWQTVLRCVVLRPSCFLALSLSVSLLQSRL